MAKFELLDRQLTDEEKYELLQFVENSVMLEAVKKVLLADVYKNGVILPDEPSEPLRNAAYTLVSQRQDEITDDQLGRNLRAQWEGVQALELGLRDIKGIVERLKNEKVADGLNPAR